MKEAQYGTWESPISADQLATSGIKFFDILTDGDYVYNVEMRPTESGRYVIVRYFKDGTKEDMLPAPFNARTRIHEYGGSSFTVHDGIIYFVNFKDQNLYKIAPNSTPQQITKDGVRFSELQMTRYGMLAVAQRHQKLADGTEDPTNADNFLALINLETGVITELATGYDFYAFPTINKPMQNNSKIAWMCWNHPNMPWDDTELWVADFVDGKIVNKKKIETGVQQQSFYQPEWDCNDNLVFIVDKSNWWNPYLWNSKTGAITHLINKESEFAQGLWNLGIRVWAQDKNLLYFVTDSEAGAQIIVVDVNQTLPNQGAITLPYTIVDRLYANAGCLYFIGASPIKAQELVRYGADGKLTVLTSSSNVKIPESDISVLQHIEFATTSRQKVAHAYYYPPKNPNFVAPAGTKPPVVVMIHGGPTSATTNAFMLGKQFWTSRGFAVADVNYGGSTGYGRKYRKALQRDNDNEAGYWGDIDIKDCAACVKYLAAEGLIDPTKAIIRGGSAGGYTTLAALAFTDVFCAGNSFYGVSDILALAHDTHKFESRYMDQIVGKLPEFEDVYNKRSPINNLATIKAPLLILQGDEDKVVPQSQADLMVEGLRKQGLRVEYKLYKGEQHGWRKAETIIDAHERELAFYLSVFYPEL